VAEQAIAGRRLESVGAAVARRYENAVSAHVCGSLVEGFGNARSDLDVYVFTEGPPALPAADSMRYDIDEFVVDMDYIDNVPVDIECWEIDRVDEVVERLNSCPTDDWGHAKSLDIACLQLAHGIRVGCAVRGVERFKQVRTRVDWQHLCQVLFCYFAHDYHNSADDAIGAIDAEDHGAALLMSRMAIGAAMDALLAASGSTNIKSKWRLSKLRQLGMGEWEQRYLAAELDPSAEPAALLSRSKERLRLASDLSVEAARLVERLPR
jgi:predicted nucleotidyltransferase